MGLLHAMAMQNPCAQDWGSRAPQKAASVLSASVSLSQRSRGPMMPLQHKHAVHLHLGLATVRGGGASSPLPSSRQGILGICFPGEAQSKQSCCRTPQRIWFPSPHCKNLLLLSNTLLQIRSGLHGFYLVTLGIRPWLMTENAPGFTLPTPPKSTFAGQPSPSSPHPATGVSC